MIPENNQEQLQKYLENSQNSQRIKDQEIENLKAEIYQIKTQLNLTRNLLANFRSTENLPFEQFSRRMRFLTSFRKKFFSNIPEHLKEVISDKIMSSTNNALLDLQYFLQEQIDNNLFDEELIIQQPLYLGNQEIPLPLLAKIIIRRNSTLPENLISRLFHAGFIYQIKGCPHNDDLFGPTIHRMITAWENAVWNYNKSPRLALIINVYSSHPYEDLDHFQPTQHHLVLEYSTGETTRFRRHNHILPIKDEECFYYNQRRYFEFSTHGLELLDKTPITSLWVPRSYSKATEKAREFPWDYSTEDISEEEDQLWK